jgi:hypothetical protein
MANNSQDIILILQVILLRNFVSCDHIL